MSDPAVFEHPFTVGPAEVDENGHLNNAAYFPHLEAAARGHWTGVFAADPAALALAWIIRRHEIDYHRPALPGERVVVRTWLGEATAATWERFSAFVRPADGQVLARARTVFVLVDPATGRPRRIDPALKARFPRPPAASPAGE